MVNRVKNPSADKPVAGPTGTTLPKVWVCGSSLQSAQVAAGLGVCYSFHAYIGRHWGDGVSGPEIIRTYKASFVPSQLQSNPECNVAVLGACSTSDPEARRNWESFFGIGNAFQFLPGAARFAIPTPCFCGDASRCKDQLLEIQDSHKIAELVVQCVGTDVNSIIQSYRILAESVHC